MQRAMQLTNVQSAQAIMRAFALRTGVDAGGGDPKRRYLWTDAFAVLASLGLYRRTAQPEHLERAARIIELVHQTLGRHRDDDDARSGWISGLGETAGFLRPTVAGLRIGKPRPERAISEPSDERLEWDRDGQYFHYLTKWMHALNAFSRATGDPEPNMQAIELAHAASAAFIHQPRAGAAKRMYWKMSIDLSRPLVASMGQHDPLDGFVAFARLQADQRRSGPMRAGLGFAIADMQGMCGEGTVWATADPLGIGGLLTDAAQLVELVSRGDMPFDGLVHTLLADAHRSLDAFTWGNELSRPLDLRLAFRELGLALGLRAIPTMYTAVRQCPNQFGNAASASALLERLESMSRMTPLAAHIEETWLDPAAQSVESWTDHLDINSVMLATSLVPDAYLPGFAAPSAIHAAVVSSSAPSSD